MKEILNKIIYILAWEPSTAKVTKGYSCRLPAIERFYRETNLSLLKSTHQYHPQLSFRCVLQWFAVFWPKKNWGLVAFNLESQNQAKKIPEFPNTNFWQIVPVVLELWSDKQTNRQTIKQRLQLWIYRYTSLRTYCVAQKKMK